MATPPYDGQAHGDDSQFDIVFDGSSTPALAPGSWLVVDLPWSAVPTLTGRSHLSQLVLASDGGTVGELTAKNLYFHD